MKLLNNNSPFDFKEFYNKDTEVFKFFFNYMLHDYNYFIKKSKEANQRKFYSFYKKHTFKKDSYEARVIEIIKTNKLYLRSKKNKITQKSEKELKKGIYFLSEEEFNIIKLMFNFYIGTVKNIINNDPKLQTKYKLEHF